MKATQLPTDLTEIDAIVVNVEFKIYLIAPIFQAYSKHN